MTSSLEDWSGLLEAKQQTFLAPVLVKASKFLRSARNLEGGWGAYPGLPSDIHYSALAIQALYEAADELSIGVIAQATLYLRQAKGNALSKLKFQELTDLLRVMRCEQKPDYEFTQALLNTLKRIYAERPLHHDAAITRDVASMLRITMSLDRADGDLIKSLTDTLLEQQRLDDGSWPAVSGEQGSVVATSVAIRALASTNDDRARDPLARGLRFVQNQLEAHGWEASGVGDVYSLAMILRAVSEVPGTDYELIQMGIDTLVEMVNEDGGWGGGPSEPSNIESTTLAVLALLAAGENRFVPARLASAALQESQRLLDQAINERNRLRDDVEMQVQNQINLVVQERDRLRRESDDNKKSTDRLNEQMRAMRNESESLMYEFYARERGRWNSNYGHVFPNLPFLPLTIQQYLWLLWPVAIIVFAVFGFGQVVKLDSSRWKLFAMVGLFLTVLYASWMLYFAISRRSRTSIIRGDEFIREPWLTRGNTSELSRLRDIYFEMQSEWPSSLREEFVYTLYTDLIDLPLDVSPRYAKELANRYPLPREYARRMQSWIDMVVRLDPTERRILFDQLRRAILR